MQTDGTPSNFLHRKHRRRSAIALLPAALPILLLLMLAAGCARAPRSPNTLRLQSDNDPSTLDPAKSYDTTSINFTRVLYRGLVDYDDNARLVDMVAKEHHISADGKTYIFILRPDVYFHSGRRVVAADFRYAIERVLDPATASDGLTFYKIIEGAAEWSDERRSDSTKQKSVEQNAVNPRDEHVRGIVVKGHDEITFHLTHPDVTFLNILALPFAYAVPQEWVEKLSKEGKTLSENPNGCGPFMLEDWRHNAWLKLVRNPRYFEPALPRAARIELAVGGGATLAQMRFELGDLDVQTKTPPADFPRIMRDPRWKPLIIHAPQMDVRYLCMNTEMEPFTDVRVRRAFNYAINRERMVPALSGQISVARGILPPGMPGYNPDLRGYTYDPEKARRLLKEAGKENLKVTLLASTTDGYDKIAQLVQQDLKQVGVQVTLKTVIYAEVKTLAGTRKKNALSLLGWSQDYPDPSNFLDVLFNSNKITNEASLNRAFYSNPKVDRLLNTAGVELNPQKRLALYRQAEQQIVDDAPWASLYHSELYVLRQPWVTGYKLHPMWSARYEYVGVNGK